jgi:hypothetical protein
LSTGAYATILFTTRELLACSNSQSSSCHPSVPADAASMHTDAVFGIAVGNDECARSDFRNIYVRAYEEQRSGKNAGRGFERLGAAHHACERRIAFRSAVKGREQHRQLGVCHDRMDLSSDGP